MKTQVNRIAVIALSVLMGVASPTVGLAVSTTHSVTVSVPEVLSISADKANFTLSFTGYVKTGDETSAETVTYTVEANNMQHIDGAVVLKGKLDFAYDKIAMKADVGAYTKTSGNTELAEAASGFITIGTTATDLAKKANTVALSSGQLLRGSIPITYKAVASEDVQAGDQTHSLEITLTHI